MSQSARTPSADELQPASPRHDLATREILDSTIGRDSVEEALQFVAFGDSPDEPPSRAAQLLALMHDPSMATATLPTLMKRVGILLPEVLDMVRKKDLAIAMVGSSRHVGNVLEGLGQMAQARWAICNLCMGEGEVVDEAASLRLKPGPGEPLPMRPCVCSNGKVRIDPNLDAAKLFLGAHGVGPKSGGAANVINVNANAQAQAGARADAGGADRRAQAQESITSRVQSMLEGGS